MTGNGTVTGDKLALLRRPLLAFCYQMLGSPFDAEDAVQDVLERVWRSRESFDPGKASLSTWCHRIAHNVCVDRLRGASRRPLPRDLRAPGIDVEAPLVPALDVPWLMPAPSAWWGESEVDAAAERTLDVRLAVTAMLQDLPPGQRGAFVLRELIGCTASETADILGTTPAAMNSALQRARSALGAQPPRQASPTRERVERYARAIQVADVAALAALVAEDVVLEMPPVLVWCRGRGAYREFMDHLFGWRGRNWTVRVLAGHAQPAFLLYLNGPEGPTPHSLQLLGVRPDGDIEHVLVYHDPRLFTLFEKATAGDR